MKLKLTDLNPDGIRVLVDWDNFPVNASVFIPAIDSELLHKQLKEIVEAYGWAMETRVCIENSKLGVRIWRVM